MWVDKKDIFPIPCYLASSDLWWLNQMKISLHGYIVTFDLTVLILLSPSWLSIFYKFVLLSFLFSCYPRIFNFCPIPASLAKINTPAAWKLWIPLFWIHFCHLWSTIHLLSYLWVWSFRIFFYVFCQTFLVDTSLLSSVCLLLFCQPCAHIQPMHLFPNPSFIPFFCRLLHFFNRFSIYLIAWKLPFLCSSPLLKGRISLSHSWWVLLWWFCIFFSTSGKFLGFPCIEFSASSPLWWEKLFICTRVEG